ncbi:hypothetical protein OH77DRAFT_1430647 [Trametes cingulata]|nr:hypothetical protein OH77DRAFT_1430647 [Trametes cingulata]
MPAKGSRGGAASGNKTTPTDASRIQSTQVSGVETRSTDGLLHRSRGQAKSGKDTGKGSFPARAQSAASANASSPPKAPKAPKA